MPGSPMQNRMFNKTEGYVQSGNPFPVSSCGRRRNAGSPLQKSNEPRKTTKGKGRNFRTVEEGAGMTAKGVASYRCKQLINRIYRILLGEEDMPTSERSIFYNNKSYTDKVYNKAIDDMIKDKNR